MFEKRIATASFATVMAVAGQAGAVVVDPTSYAPCLGLAACVIPGATLTAQGPNAVFSEQDFRIGGGTNKGLGISSDIKAGAARDLEIQGDGGATPPGAWLEGVLISFTSPQIVNEIVLAQFYNPDSFGPLGDPAEIAIICANVTTCGTIQNFNDSGTSTGFLLGGA